MLFSPILPFSRGCGRWLNLLLHSCGHFLGHFLRGCRCFLRCCRCFWCLRFNPLRCFRCRFLVLLRNRAYESKC